MAYPHPNIIPHPPNDHRYIEASELLSLKFYNNYMFKPFSDIIDYVMLPNFLKSTSKWTEAHLTAFRCLRLENLPASRIVPVSEIPDDNDPRMKLVIEHLLASEDDIRSGNAELGFGPATTFYTQFQVVLRRLKSGSEPILIPPTFGSPTFSAVFPPIVESQGSTQIEDALNDAGIAFLELLCSFHWSAFKDFQRRIRFRCPSFVIFNIFSRKSMDPSLVIHGQVVRSYNDGSFYVERRSARLNDWVSQDSYPRASLEVYSGVLV